MVDKEERPPGINDRPGFGVTRQLKWEDGNANAASNKKMQLQHL
jgi:hypothetical protein